MLDVKIRQKNSFIIDFSESKLKSKIIDFFKVKPDRKILWVDEGDIMLLYNEKLLSLYITRKAMKARSIKYCIRLNK